MRTSLVDYVTLTPAQHEQLALIQVDAAQQEFSSDIARGLAVLQALPDAARSVWPASTHLMLMVDADNDAARGLYLKQGFVDSGETFHGRVGEERRLTLPLSP